MNSLSKNACDRPGQLAAGRVTKNAHRGAPICAPQIVPRVIHCRHCDLSALELSQLRSALARVPGDSEGRARLWENFECDHANVFIGRNTAGQIAFFVFFEVRVHAKTSARQFFCAAACALQPSRTLTESTFPQLENFAVRLHCQSMALSTPRPGLVAKLLRMPGWYLDREENNEWLVCKRLGPDLSHL